MRNKNHYMLVMSYLLICTLFLPVFASGQRLVRPPTSLQTPFEYKETVLFTGDKLSPDLRELIAVADQNRTVRVILQSDDLGDPQLLSELQRNNVNIAARITGLNMLVVDIPVFAIEQIAAVKVVKNLSLDREIKKLGHIETTTGVAAMRAIAGNSTIDGRGIGIAVLDSDIYAGHDEFSDATGRNSRVIANQLFTTGGTEDLYGHGTHVAALAAGRGGRSGDVISTSILRDYQGIAPGANIIAVRVLNDAGNGSSSSLIQALDWVYTNRTAFNIRVVNLSLGSPAVETWRTDPVCVAARRLTNAGVVVVAAAGNDGKNLLGQKTYGAIHSPGIDPNVITVGATNTFGTDSRGDDGIATYSSRGPTRSYYTDVSGMRQYDNLAKPDVVAPGNKIVSARSRVSTLALMNPTNEILTDGLSPKTQLLYMSGTSMATPIVSGAAALILQANPTLTPSLVKMILMYTAQPLANFNQLEQGAGAINIEGAIRLAKLIRTDLDKKTALGTPLLTTTILPSQASSPTQQSTIAGQTVRWSQGITVNQGYARGSNLITKYQKIYRLGSALSDGFSLADGILVGDGILVSDGIIVGDGIIMSDGTLLGDGTLFLDYSSYFGPGILSPDGILVADGIIVSDSLLLSDGTLSLGMLTTGVQTLIGGDLTAIMH